MAITNVSFYDGVDGATVSASVPADKVKWEPQHSSGGVKTPVKFSKVNNGFAVKASGNGVGVNEGHWYPIGNGLTSLSITSDDEEVSLDEPIQTNKWYHISFTFDTSQFNFEAINALFGKNSVPLNEMPEPEDVNAPPTEEWVPGKTPLF